MLHSGAAEIALQHKTGKTFADIEALYALREQDIDFLVKTGRITERDLRDLDRLGRVSVAGDHWVLCTEEARQALLNDAHAHVRAAAALSAKAGV